MQIEIILQSMDYISISLVKLILPNSIYWSAIALEKVKLSSCFGLAV
jgi:hypothetical protein